MSIQEWNAGKLLKTSGSYWMACTLHAAVRLGVFTVIGNDMVEPEEIADRLEVDLRGARMLLNALTAMGLLTKKEGRYANTPWSKTLLVDGSPKYIGHMIIHHYHLVDAWSKLPQAIRSGRPVRRVSYGEEEERESFLMGMFNVAMEVAPEVVSQIDLTNRTHLLDLGGGPGTYAIHFCIANPQLRATVYDLSTTRPFALKTVERFGLAERIDFMAGNYIEDEIKGLYDVAWLSHILHGEGPADCEKIIKKAVSVLKPGGLILIHDFILDDTLDGPLFPALFSLNMLLNTDQGQSYSESEIMGMLSRAGAKDVQRLPFRGFNDSGIVSGVV
nr:methyltransferase [Desulfobacterales bacterium]